MLRMLSVSSTDVVEEVELDRFKLTETGRLMRSDALRKMVELELGNTVHYELWRPIVDHIKMGTQNSFRSNLGADTAFDFMDNGTPQAIHYRHVPLKRRK